MNTLNTQDQIVNLRLTINRLDKKLESVYDNPRHLREASNGVFASAVRAGINLGDFLDAIENHTAFDFDKFASSTNGNFLNFIKSEYQLMAQPLIDITAGGNGGMASIGRGEFAIAFLSNFRSIITKSGNGDLSHNGKFEEVKHNGGKLSIEDKAGNEILEHSKLLQKIKILF